MWKIVLHEFSSESMPGVFSYQINQTLLFSWKLYLFWKWLLARGLLMMSFPNWHAFYLSAISVLRLVSYSIWQLLCYSYWTMRADLVFCTHDSKKWLTDCCVSTKINDDCILLIQIDTELQVLRSFYVNKSACLLSILPLMMLPSWQKNQGSTSLYTPNLYSLQTRVLWWFFSNHFAFAAICFSNVLWLWATPIASTLRPCCQACWVVEFTWKYRPSA